MAAEQAARNSFGRLVAYLAARSLDVAGAEDALADALVSALERWPTAGIPDNPDAWLLTVARRRLIDRARHAGLAGGVADRLQLAQDEAEAAVIDASGFPDERLALLFVCAHPAIEPSSRTPLMLQIVLGFTADRIASAFLVSPPAMTKRLTRAKAKIRDAGIAFTLPDRDVLASRLKAVLAAIYAAYGLGWDDAFASDHKRVGLAEEAIFLGHLVVELLPGEPESEGLLALMMFCEARRDARRAADGADGAYVPIGEQKTASWSQALIDQAEEVLRRAATKGRMGRYQLEAAIQAVHIQRRVTNAVDWTAIVLLYEGLAALSPTLGATVGLAAARCEAGNPQEALTILDAVARDRIEMYQPFWATRAHTLQKLGRIADAADDFAIAAGLSEDVAVRTYLLDRRKRLSN